MIKKNYLKVMALTAVMAFAFTGCAKELDTDPQVNGPTGDQTEQEDMRKEDINPADSQPDTLDTEKVEDPVGEENLIEIDDADTDDNVDTNDNTETEKAK